MIIEDIFNSNTINIFTDASIKKVKEFKEEIGCPGYIITYKKNNDIIKIIESDCNIIRQSTNNESEITAIYMGIMAALKYKDKIKHINLFSDSKICIYGLTQWIYKWYNNQQNGRFISSNGGYVKNQDIIINIINTICNNNLSINLYHQKGHVNIKDRYSVENAIKVFHESNNIKTSYSLMHILSKYNDYIDVLTGNVLERNIYEKFDRGNSAIEFIPNFNIKKYSTLIRGEN